MSAPRDDARDRVLRGAAALEEVDRPLGGPAPGSRRVVLVVDDDPAVRAVMRATLSSAGFEVIEAATGIEALAHLHRVIPDAIVSDVMMPDLDGFGLVRAVRDDPVLRTVPLLFVTTRSAMDDMVKGLGLGADDYLVKPFRPAELIARVTAKVERPPVPIDLLPIERSSGAATPREVTAWLTLEQARAHAGGVVANIRIAERRQIAAAFGARGISEVDRQVTAVIRGAAGASAIVGRDGVGGWFIALPDTEPSEAGPTLAAVARLIHDAVFTAGGERVRPTPSVGYHPTAGPDPATVLARASMAAAAAEAHLDLLPVPYSGALEVDEHARRAARSPWVRRVGARIRTPFQILVTFVLGWIVPYIAYVAAGAAGVDLAGAMYIVVVIALVLTGVLIWAEGLASLRVAQPPDRPTMAYPPASAVIAAYLPNEAATIVETISTFLEVDYPAHLQVILAYNTPTAHPVEAVLAQIAERDPRFVPYRVADSTSKAQNVNAALSIVSGEFVGVFDADHHPQPDSFRRAWRWLDGGADVVQGHPVVRNGDASRVARTVAVEFEVIYGVSHPGRAKMHGFGIFGGSNGYWRTDLLRSTRMRGRMLTEDIDSSLRAVEAGRRIVSDPRLVSRELATTTVRQLWNQRMRWAQGWFQVSLRHTLRALRSPNLRLRQKLGFLHLLAWRELYPWLSLQIIPIIAYWLTVEGGVSWFVPILILAALFTFSVGPGQTLFAYRAANPEIKRHRVWFLAYLFVSTLVYAEFKNLITRVAQVKEFMGDRQWKVTPRPTSAPKPSP